jgi:hypothetical protein
VGLEAENTAVRIICADHVALTSPTSGGRSVDIISSRTQATDLLVGLERVPLSPVSTVEELLEIESIGSGVENRVYGRRDP